MNRRSLAAFAIGLAAALAAGWLAFPRWLYVSADQPLSFNHRLHTSDATGFACADCHAVRADGEFAGIPPVESCAACHAEPVGATAAEKRLVEEFVKPGREIPWRVYARQPDNVRFPHAPHVRRAKLSCESCHGAHGTSETLVAFQADRVSGYARGLITMDRCESCHRETGRGPLACIGCHR
jgi:hypothetical protein